MRPSEGKPGDVVRDADGNLWCKAFTGTGYRLVYVFNPLALPDGTPLSHGREGMTVVSATGMRAPLTLISRKGFHSGTPGAGEDPPVPPRLARASASTRRLKSDPVPYTLARCCVLTYAAEGWLAVSRTPSLGRVWRKAGEPISDAEGVAAGEMANHSLIGFYERGLFGVYSGKAHITDLGRETLTRWQATRATLGSG